MSNRISFKGVLPEGYEAFVVSSKFSNQSGLDLKLQELIKMRASQLNSCVYCLDMHLAEARKLGIPDEQIFTLTAWHESPFFTEKEKAVLALTDSMTMVAEGGVDDEIYDEALAHLGEQNLAKAMMAICVINTWNRLMVATLAPPESLKRKKK